MDAFEQETSAEDRAEFVKEWHQARDLAKYAHHGMYQSAKRKGHPGNLVHDYMTVLIFGDTAAAARMKALIDDATDPTIGLNHQEDINGMKILAEAKCKYANKRNGDWRSQVEWAVAEVSR